jgi:hypothetical protein
MGRSVTTVALCPGLVRNSQLGLIHFGGRDVFPTELLDHVLRIMNSEK